MKKELSNSKLRRDGTPANFYDFNNVTLRAIDALHKVEQLGDISNRVRTDALRTRHFLADDYEDQRFHGDWTLVQMFGPAAGMLRHFVESASNDLKESSPPQ